MEIEVTNQVLLWAFGIAVIMGAVVNKTSFCTMGAVSDWVNMGDMNRLRTWFLAIAVALFGVVLLEANQAVAIDPSLPPYRNANFAWLRFIIGGLIFGVGMVYARGCGNKTLIRIGGGSIKSIFVLIVAGFFAFLMTKTAFYETLFHGWVTATSIDLTQFGMNSQDLGSVIGGIIGSQDINQLRTIIGLIAVTIIMVIIFKSADFRSSYEDIFAGAVIGATIVAAWYITGGSIGEQWKEAADFMDVVPVGVASQSYTFINPMGDTFYYLMTPSNTSLISFGVAALAGVITGSFIYSVLSRTFRIEWFISMEDFISHLIGGALIGIGGVLSMGCTIGQGITGVSTLAMGSILTLASIILGAAMTLKIIYYKMVYEDDATFGKSFITALVDLRLLPESMRKLKNI